MQAKRPQQEMTSQQWNEAIHDALMESVKRRLQIADVPVGVLLSGGLDSSLLVGLLAEAGVGKIKTYSIGFEDQPEEKGNEFEFSDPVAQMYDTDHHKYLIPNDDVLKRLPEAVRAMAEPMVGQDAVAFYLLSEQVSKSVKVVQSGQGADEVFAGYFWYQKMREAKGSPLQRFSPLYVDRDHEEFCDSVDSKYRSEDFTTELIDDHLNTEHADTFIDAVLRFDVTTLIVDDPVKRVDNMTMAWGLEARVPFLDHHLVELAASCPPELKLKHEGKGVLKQIARGRVPDAVIDRPKGYFPMPALKYVRGDFYQFMADTLNSQASRGMAWGLEARVPFLGHHLVELAASCPPELKLKHEGKGVLKQIARGRVPDAVIDRPKGYFPMPALKYVRGDFYQFMADTLNSQASRERGIFNRAYLDRLLNEPEQHFTRLNGSKLWHSALLEYWLQQHVG